MKYLKLYEEYTSKLNEDILDDAKAALENEYDWTNIEFEGDLSVRFDYDRGRNSMWVNKSGSISGNVPSRNARGVWKALDKLGLKESKLNEGFKKGDKVKYIGKRTVFTKLDPKKVYDVQDVVSDGKGGWTIVVNPEIDKYSNYKGGVMVKPKDLKKESINEGWKDEHGYDPEGVTTIDGTALTNGMSIKKLIKLWKKDIKLEKKIGESPDGSLVNYYSKESYELVTLLHKKYGWDFEVEFYRTAWNYGGHISPSYRLKGPWESRKAPITINSGRAGGSGGVQFMGVLDGLDISGSGFRGDKIESGTHYSWSINAASEFAEFFAIISGSFDRAYNLPMTAKNMVSLGKGFIKLRKAWMKIWGTGGKLDKAWDEFGALRPRKNFGITYSAPSLYPKYVKWYIDLPREFRHPDEYGGQDNWSDEKWEMDAAQEKVSSIITNFCRKHGIDDWISADR